MAENITEKIQELKKKKNAVILVHNYQPEEIQDISDYNGDSLELSIKASKTDAQIIIFCGVHFMAETASILCPDKKVVMPDASAGCPMADMITVEKLIALKRENPGKTVVAYVNTSAAVKAETDICCTSGNVVKVVNSIEREKKIIFIPDKYLGQYVASKTGREMILWNGYCPTHARILPEHILEAKKLHPESKVVVHPECTPQVIALADEVASTSGMCRYAKSSNAKEIIVGTEIGILHRLRKENPDKKFYPATQLAVCENMKKTTLDKIIDALEKGENEVKVPKEIRERAIEPIRRMLSLA